MATGSHAAHGLARGGVDGTLTGLRHSRRREAFCVGGGGSTPTGEPSGEPSTWRARDTTALWCRPPALWPADARSGRTSSWGWAQLAAMRPVMVRASPRSTPLSGALVVGLTESAGARGTSPAPPEGRTARHPVARPRPPGRPGSTTRVVDPSPAAWGGRCAQIILSSSPGRRQAVSPASTSLNTKPRQLVAFDLGSAFSSRQPMTPARARKATPLATWPSPDRHP
jgi:hypothetical protein